MNKLVINTETQEETLVDYNSKELALAKIYLKEAEDLQAEAEAKATAKAELLTKLGITADEATLLLG